MLAIANTTTQTVTTTHSITVQVQSPSFLLLGLPPDLLAIFAISFMLIVFAIFKYNVKGIPVVVKWLYKNGAAVQMRARQDLNGLFIDVLNVRGKRVEVLKQTGLPLEVSILPGKFKAYVEAPKRQAFDEKTLDYLRANGYSCFPSKTDRHNRVKGYLIEKEKQPERTMAYLDVSLGGMKRVKEYAAVEGTGQTIDWFPRIQGASMLDTGSSVILNEMQAAAKSFFRMWAESMMGTMKAMILPMCAGGGLVAIIFLLISIISGHPI